MFVAGARTQLLMQGRPERRGACAPVLRNHERERANLRLWLLYEKKEAQELVGVREAIFTTPIIQHLS